jgi:hypothetical protein
MNSALLNRAARRGFNPMFAFAQKDGNGLSLEMDKFPPQSTREEDIEVLLGILRSMLSDRKAIYLSAPITSGRLLIEQRKSAKEDDSTVLSESDLSSMVAENRRRAKKVKVRLIDHLDGIIIDPTAVPDFDGWTQNDYRYLWARVIDSYVDTVVSIDGWHYSNGCAYEFLVASQLSLRTLDQNLAPMTVGQGKTQIAQAIQEFRESGFDTQFLDCVFSNLAKIEKN